jgi:hypothetical protein
MASCDVLDGGNQGPADPVERVVLVAAAVHGRRVILHKDRGFTMDDHPWYWLAELARPTASM